MYIMFMLAFILLYRKQQAEEVLFPTKQTRCSYLYTIYGFYMTISVNANNRASIFYMQTEVIRHGFVILPPQNAGFLQVAKTICS